MEMAFIAGLFALVIAVLAVLGFLASGQAFVAGGLAMLVGVILVLVGWQALAWVALAMSGACIFYGAILQHRKAEN